MAVIAEDTRLTIATRLANLNYKEKLDALQEKLNEAYLIYIWISLQPTGTKRTTMLRSQHRTCMTLSRIFVRH